jgi:uncharacterized membrane protein
MLADDANPATDNWLGGIEFVPPAAGKSIRAPLNRRHQTKRMEALTLSVPLLLALVPSLFAAWRSVLVASGCYLVLLLAGLVSALWYFDATSAQGPAFAGLILLAGLTTCLLAASCVIRLAVGLAMSRLTPASAGRLRRVLMGSGVAATGLAMAGVLDSSVHRGFAITVGAASVWLCVVAWRTPVNSCKTAPCHDAA